MDAVKDPKNIRSRILEMVHRSGEGHIPSAFSVVEILYAAYSGMNLKEDAFFLSKGHASAGFYAVLAHFGVLDPKELDTFCDYDSILGGHPKKYGEKMMNSSGSLGHGLAMATGYALAKRIRKEPGRVFCLIGDGEANEGTIWEAAIHAEQLGLKNLVCIVDDNNSQTRAMVSIQLKQKFEAFGWNTCAVNGHDIPELSAALFGSAALATEKPFCVVAKTVKGKGIKRMEEDSFAWHHKAPTKEELVAFKEELAL